MQASLGHRTGIVDLTQGEGGTRGSAEERAAEAAAAARILRVAHREALDLPDGNITNSYENRLKLAEVIRRLRPRVVILPYWQGRHPDHYTSSALGYEACFVAGLSKVHLPGDCLPHRPYKILYASLYADVRPTFVVDITPYLDTRFAALMAYTSSTASTRKAEAFLCPGKTSKSAWRLQLDTMDFWQVCGTLNRSCRRKFHCSEIYLSWA